MLTVISKIAFHESFLMLFLSTLIITSAGISAFFTV